MTRRHSGPSDKTRNFKKFRLVISFPGSEIKHFTTASKKEMRPAIERNTARGARVEEQKHTGYGAYTTVAVHEPTNRKAGRP
jgi:hypothetical protein